MQKRRRTYWMTGRVSAACKARATLLDNLGREVRFFTSLDSLASELKIQRAGILIISDDGEPNALVPTLLHLMSLPEIQGAKLVLTTTGHQESLSYLAGCGNFRDIIPMEIDDRQWLQRFTFATASQATHFVQPAGQLTLNNISAVTLPARVTWMSESKIRLECRIQPQRGAVLKMGGALSEALGVPTLTLRVIETQRERLLFRFSDAILCQWSVPPSAKGNAQDIIKAMKRQSFSSRYRIFIAVRSPGLRGSLINGFEGPQFEVSAALRKQSIVTEPRYFTPDLIFIEDCFCIGEERQRFAAMLDHVPRESLVVVLGPQVVPSELKTVCPDRNLMFLSTLPTDFPQSGSKHFLNLLQELHEQKEGGGCHINAEDSYSLAHLVLPARLTRIHPHAAQVALSCRIGNFALCRLESTIIRKATGRNPWFKVTATYQDTRPDAGTYQFLADGYLADLNGDETQKLGQHLADLFVKHVSGVKSNPLESHDSTGRIPELGSVREAETMPLAARRPPPVVASASNSVSTPPAAAMDQPAIATPQSAAVVKKQASEPRPSPHPETAILEPDFFEKIDEFKRDVVGSIRESVNDKRFRNGLVYVASVGFVLAILWVLIAVVGPNREKSGKEYSESLKKFAPHLNRPNKDH